MTDKNVQLIERLKIMNLNRIMFSEPSKTDQQNESKRTNMNNINIMKLKNVYCL